jgi:hypothetical protein
MRKRLQHMNESAVFVRDVPMVLSIGNGESLLFMGKFSSCWRSQDLPEKRRSNCGKP